MRAAPAERTDEIASEAFLVNRFEAGIAVDFGVGRILVERLVEALGLGVALDLERH